MHAVYVLARTVRGWASNQLAGWLDTIVEAGINTVITKAQHVPGPLIDQCRRRGVSLVGSFACFSDHDQPQPEPDVMRPVDERGKRFERMEWYSGLIPTDDAYNDRLVTGCAALLDGDGLEGLVLDFLRWPGHWELELRPGRRPRQSSYDPTTLRRFRGYLSGTGQDPHGIEVDDPVRSAAAIQTHHAQAWIRFRCDVITETTVRLGELIRAHGRWAGVFVVPTTHDVRRETFGQDTGQLGRHLDALFPMTYHAILHRPPAWVGTVADDVRAKTDTPVVPMVQATSAPEFAGGADWGPPVEADEFRLALEAARSAATAGFCVFPGESLDPQRRRVVSEASSHGTRNGRRKERR